MWAVEQARLEGVAAGAARRVEGVRFGAELADHQHLARRTCGPSPPAARASARPAGRGCRWRRVIPAGVVGLGDRVDVRVERAGVRGRVVAPHVHAPPFAPGSVVCSQWASVLHVRAPRSRRGRCPRPRRRGSRRRSTGAASPRAPPCAPAARPCAAARGGRVPVAGPFDRADALPHAGSRRRRAVRAGPGRAGAGSARRSRRSPCSSATIRVLVGGRSARRRARARPPGWSRRAGAGAGR